MFKFLEQESANLHFDSFIFKQRLKSFMISSISVEIYVHNFKNKNF